MVVPHVIAHFGKLIEDHAVGFSLELMGLVKDLLNVGFGSGCRDDLAGHCLQPFKTFAAHSLRKDGHAVAAQEL